MFYSTPLLLELLDMGAGSPATPPSVTREAVGWYAADDGLVAAWSGPRYKDPADAIRIWMDYCPVQEIRDGDTIVSATVSTSLPKLDVSVSGNRVLVTVYGGQSFSEYAVVFTATLSSGPIVSRTGIVRVSPGGLGV